MSDALLTATDITVRFGGLVAVDNVSLDVGRGEIVGMIGPNGAGKTTTFGAMWGLVPLAAGSVAFAGHDVTRWSPARRSRLGMARTFQRLEMFGSMTVRENLLYASEAHALGERPWRLFGGRKHQDADRVDELIDMVGLAPHVDRAVGDLPIGVNRLVEFGRALATQPSLLLLDEPSSGLDVSETIVFGDHVRNAVERLGCGVLLIEHDMSLVTRTCERLYVLDFGRLIAEGPTSSVITDERVKAAYLGSTEVHLDGEPTGAR